MCPVSQTWGTYYGDGGFRFCGLVEHHIALLTEVGQLQGPVVDCPDLVFLASASPCSAPKVVRQHPLCRVCMNM